MTSELRRRPNATSSSAGAGNKSAGAGNAKGNGNMSNGNNDDKATSNSPYHFLIPNNSNENEEEDENEENMASSSKESSSKDSTAPSTPSRARNRKDDDSSTINNGGFNFFGLFTPPKSQPSSTSTQTPAAKNTRILIEIVAAQNLSPITDLLGNKANDLILSDGAGNPYVTIRMPGTSSTTSSTSISSGSNANAPLIHKTRPSRTKSLSPIWTVRSSSLYLLLVNDKEFELSTGLLFEVLTGRGALMPFSHGMVMVPPEIVLEGKGERLEFQLKSKDTKDATDDGANDNENTDDDKAQSNILALRFRRATEEDVRFMLAVQKDRELQQSVSQINATKKKDAAKATDDEEPMDAFDKKLFVGGAADFQFKQERPPRGHRQKRTAKQLNLVEIRGGSKGDEAVEKEQLVRVQPYPDPRREAETTWLSPKEIEQEAMAASQKWIKAGSGAFGTMYVEILSCDGLPNLDETMATAATGDKTDAFVAMLFEDTLIRTDVIFDRLNPRWMPWSMRAFAFPIQHPGSPLILGVFDYDDGPMNAHDPIGRVVINMSQLECDTVYNLSYRLHNSPTKDDDQGTLKLRLRFEYNNEKEAYRESFSKAPRFHVNVDNTKAFDVLKYMIKGGVNMDHATTQTVKLYAYEWLSYFEYYFYAIDFMIGVLLWRGDAKVSDRHIWFPLHSVVLFLSVVTVIEHPSLIPAAFFLAISYVMGTIGYMRSHYPSPWDRCKSIKEVTSVITTGKNINRPITINANDGAEEAELLDKVNKAKTDRVITFLKAVKTAGLKFNREYNKTDAEALAIETEDVDNSYLGQYLYYIHLPLSYMCLYSRALRNLVTWRSPTSYYVTVYCFFAGVTLLIIPWGFLLTWISRILAWTLLGPWMKLLDIYFVKGYYRTRAELAADPTIEEPDIDALFADAKYSALAKKVRVAAEDAIKLKEMREHRFGTFSARVPAFDDSRFPSIPMPQSTARPCDTSGAHGIECHYLGPNECSFVDLPGQKLYGTMIHSHGEASAAPKIEEEK